MTEQVKTAISEKFAPAIDFRAPYAKVMLDAATYAVIVAMREPTNAMLNAGREPLDSLSDPALSPAFLDEAWRRMIDEAMKE